MIVSENRWMDLKASDLWLPRVYLETYLLNCLSHIYYISFNPLEPWNCSFPVYALIHSGKTLNITSEIPLFQFCFFTFIFYVSMCFWSPLVSFASKKEASVFAIESKKNHRKKLFPSDVINAFIATDKNVCDCMLSKTRKETWSLFLKNHCSIFSPTYAKNIEYIFAHSFRHWHNICEK